MDYQRKKELMEKFDIKSVGGGHFGEGFFECLDGIDKGIIKVKITQKMGQINTGGKQ